MCTLPLLKRVCRESYSSPDAVYQKLKRSGMDLVTVTDHDSIEAAESLRSRPDFFLSEEVTAVLPSGTLVHIGVFDINERQHAAITRRRKDFEALTAYLGEQRLLFAVNHALSRLTGPRSICDFWCFRNLFPAMETHNGQMPDCVNRRAAELARRWALAPICGSDAHSVASAGSAWTEVPGARTKEEFMLGLRHGLGLARGQSGSWWKLTRDILRISAGMVLENPLTLALAPLAPLVPLATLANSARETAFSRCWSRRIETDPPARSTLDAAEAA